MSGLLHALERGRRPRVLVLVDLVQDIDVLLPVLLALRSSATLVPVIRVSRWLSRESPRTEALLRSHGFAFGRVRRREVVEGRAPSLRGIGAVLTASESSSPAHAAGHALARRARDAGVAAYTVQHGFENVGLFGHGAGEAHFASATVFCWFPPSATPDDLPAETLARLAHVGRPAPAGGWRAAPQDRFDLGVFENLHWDRYTDADRQAFTEGLIATARALPDARILVRPHPAGGWADQLSHELAQFANITAALASETRRDMAGGAQVLQGIRRVITTPSTVAMDAALAGLPVALAAAGGAAYQPLPVLRTPQDWVQFARGDAIGTAPLDQFLARVLVAGDGAPRIAERLGRDLKNQVAPN